MTNRTRDTQSKWVESMNRVGVLKHDRINEILHLFCDSVHIFNHEREHLTGIYLISSREQMTLKANIQNISAIKSH